MEADVAPHTAPLLDRTSSEGQAKRKRRVQVIVAAVVSVVIVVALGFQFGVFKYVFNVVKLGWGKLKDLGLAAIPIVVLLSWAITSVSGPAVLVEVGAGALFQQMWPHDSKGILIAIPTVCFGIWLGCITAFVLGRRCFKDAATEVIKQHEILQTVNEIIGEEGWKFAFLMRLNPLIPFELFNYAVAMTDISAFHNAIAALGTMPIVTFEVYTAASGAQIAASAAGKQDAGQGNKIRDVLIKLAISSVLIAVVCVYGKTKYTAKVKAKEALKRTQTPEDPGSPTTRLRKASSGTVETLASTLTRYPSGIIGQRSSRSIP